MRKVLLGILVVAVLLSISLPTYAATTDPIVPMYDYVSTVQGILTIDESSGIATCYGRIDAVLFNNVKVTVRLQRYNNGYWTTLKTWGTTAMRSAICSNQYAIVSGYRYRVSVTGYVYDSEGVIIETASVKHEVNYP